MDVGRAGSILAVLLVATGCGAQPGARPATTATASATSAASPSPSPSPSSSPTSPSPSPTPSAAPRQPTVSITVPKSLQQPRRDVQILGSDVSWPQCPVGMGIPQKQGKGAPGPLPEARYVVLGLTNGPGFTPNPCLADQLRLVRERHLYGAAYAVASFPDTSTQRRYAAQGPFDAGTRLGRLSNVGYQQALFNVATMKRVGLTTPFVWIDVEPVPDFDWSPDLVANAAVIRGVARGYRSAGYRIGAYSTQSLWQRVVDDLRLGVPEWRAAGQTSRAEAVRRCGPERMFQGGAGVLSQWVGEARDQNITCPGTSVRMGAWFHQY